MLLNNYIEIIKELNWNDKTLLFLKIIMRCKNERIHNAVTSLSIEEAVNYLQESWEEQNIQMSFQRDELLKGFYTLNDNKSDIKF